MTSGLVVIHCHIDDTENGPELVIEDKLEFVMTKGYGEIAAGNLHDICREAVVSELFMATRDCK